MSTAEAILRVGAGLGAVAIVVAMLHYGTRGRDKDGDVADGMGCLLVIAGAIALTLALGAVAGPDAVRAFWG